MNVFEMFANIVLNNNLVRSHTGERKDVAEVNGGEKILTHNELALAGESFERKKTFELFVL